MLENIPKFALLQLGDVKGINRNTGNASRGPFDSFSLFHNFQEEYFMLHL
jgi:hypothetical protein